MKQSAAQAGRRKTRTATTALLLAAAAMVLGGIQVVADHGNGHGVHPNDPVCYGTVAGLDIRTATIADLQQGLNEGRFTSVDLVEAYIQRIAALDNRGNESTSLNGVRMISPTALADAAAADAARAEAKAAGISLGPMHGIPVMMKDNIGTHDMPTTAGSIALQQNFPIKDAGLVTKLRASGAIVMGKLELLEWANWGAPSNGSSVGGPQHNGYNGGSASASSSGPGVSGSMAYSAVTLGSETSGSILGPTQTNSLAGLKTSHGLVSGAGVIPIAHYFDVVGPMGRNVYDLAVTLDAIAGNDPDDRFSTEADAHIPDGGFVSLLSTHALEGVRIGYNENSNGTLFLQALEEVRQLGAILVPIGDTSAQNGAGFAEWTALPNEFHQEINEYFANEADPTLPFDTWHELMLYNSQNYPEAHGPLGASGLALASAATPGRAEITEVHAPAMVAVTRAIADSIFADNDIAAVFSAGSAFTGLGAAAGYPTAMVPMGYTTTSAQAMSFFGPRFSDGELLSYAYALEQVRERRIIPEDFNPKLLAGLCDDTAPGNGGGQDNVPNQAPSEPASPFDLDVAAPRQPVVRIPV